MHIGIAWLEQYLFISLQTLMSAAVTRASMVPHVVTRWMVTRVYVLVAGRERIVIKVHT